MVLAMSQAACRSAAAPSDPYAGTWRGSATDDLAGATSALVTISERSETPGTWQWQGVSLITGTLLASPALTGDPRRHFSLRCDAAAGGGAGLLSVVLNGTSLSGTYVLAGCQGLSRGSVQLTRR